MAKFDVRIVDNGGNQVVNTEVWQTEGGETDIYAGEPVKQKAAGSKYAIPLADDEPTIGTTVPVLGLAASDSTHTATADGQVEVFVAQSGVTYAFKAKDASNVDTEAKVKALVGKTVGLDLTGTTYSIDTTDSSAANKGWLIVGGDHNKRELYVRLRNAAMDGPVA